MSKPTLTHPTLRTVAAPSDETGRPPRRPMLGEIVHFVLLDGPWRGYHRAAIVTGAFLGGAVNLTVFLDQAIDVPPELQTDGTAPPMSPFEPLARVWSPTYDADGTPGTWHYPERSQPTS